MEKTLSNTQNTYNCILCGKSLFTEFVPFAGTTIQNKECSFDYARCKNCNSILRLSNIDANYMMYPTWGNVSKLSLNRLLRFFSSCKIGKNDSILDYGCGSGALVSKLKKKGFSHIKGYEPYNDKYSKTLDNREVFSLVYSLYVFEHLTNFKKFFVNLDRVTNSKSKIMILCPSATRFPALNTQCPLQRITIHAPYHAFIPSDDMVIKLFAENKYRLVSLLPYDIQRSGFVFNNTVITFFFEAFGRTKDGLLSATFIDKITEVFKSPVHFFKSMFLYTRDSFVSTFLFEKL